MEPLHAELKCVNRSEAHLFTELIHLCPLFIGQLRPRLAYQRDTILYETHVLAAALHRVLEARHPGLDLFARLLLPRQERALDQGEVDAELRVMLEELRSCAAAGGVKLRGELVTGRPEAVCRAAVQQFGRYHRRRAVVMEGTRLVLENPGPALFYARRVEGYVAAVAPDQGDSR